LPRRCYGNPNPKRKLMALIEAQKVQVRKYLGYPSLYSNSFFALNSALDVISAELQTEVEAILASLVIVESKLAGTLTTAGLSSVGQGDPEWYEGAKLKEIRAEGRRFCARLSSLLGIFLRDDAFGESGSSGGSDVTEYGVFRPHFG
jgi:hypothetical protein